MRQGLRIVVVVAVAAENAPYGKGLGVVGGDGFGIGGHLMVSTTATSFVPHRCFAPLPPILAPPCPRFLCRTCYQTQLLSRGEEEKLRRGRYENRERKQEDKGEEEINRGG